VLTSAARAKALKKPPVYVLGTGTSITHASISNMPDLTRTGAIASGARAYQAAGLGPQDMDMAELYDAFTINTILFLEDLGFCKKGEGGGFVANGRIAPGGAFPVNTNGGGLSYCHPRRVWCAASAQARYRLCAWQWGRAVGAEHGDFRRGGGGLGKTTFLDACFDRAP
jgi:acetyl-CoA acetyltransferase